MSKICTAKTTVWVINTCIPEDRIPTYPSAFGTKAACDTEFDRLMRAEWESNRPRDEDTNEYLPYPDDASEAHDILSENEAWGQYLITSHEIDVVIDLALISSSSEN